MTMNTPPQAPTAPAAAVPPPQPMPAPSVSRPRWLHPAYAADAPHAPWWKGALTILALAAAYAVVSVVLTVPAFFVAHALGFTGAVNPATFLALNLTWAVMIPLAPLVCRAILGTPKGALVSVAGRLRWRRVGRALLWVLPLYLLAVGASALVGPKQGDGVVTPTLLALGVVVLLTTPLQAAGEEYTFRGAVFTCAAWGRTQRTALVVGAAVSSVVFGIAHGATDPWLAAYYTLFGVGMALLTRLSRGLEFAVVVHAVNNVLFFAVGIAQGMDPNTAFDRSNGHGGAFILVPLAFLAVACLIAWALERRDARTAALAG